MGPFETIRLCMPVNRVKPEILIVVAFTGCTASGDPPSVTVELLVKFDPVSDTLNTPLGIEGWLTCMITGGELVTMVAMALMVWPFNVAEIVTVAGFGICDGAVYRPPCVIVPMVGSPGPLFTLHEA